MIFLDISHHSDARWLKATRVGHFVGRLFKKEDQIYNCEVSKRWGVHGKSFWSNNFHMHYPWFLDICHHSDAGWLKTSKCSKARHFQYPGVMKVEQIPSFKALICSKMNLFQYVACKMYYRWPIKCDFMPCQHHIGGHIYLRLFRVNYFCIIQYTSWDKCGCGSQ